MAAQAIKAAKEQAIAKKAKAKAKVAEANRAAAAAKAGPNAPTRAPTGKRGLDKLGINIEPKAGPQGPQEVKVGLHEIDHEIMGLNKQLG